MARQYDVVLIHSRRDPAAAVQIAEDLQGYGVDVWLDEWELSPGQDWHEEFAATLAVTRAAVVLVGKDETGPWQDARIATYLKSCAQRKLKLILVFLAGADQSSELPSYFEDRTWMDFRQGLTADGLERLVWRITGRPPVAPSREIRISTAQLPVTSDNMFGRSAELKQLDHAWENPDTRVVSIVGANGLGKSAMVNHWLRWMAPDGYRGADRIYGWSFDTSERGAGATSVNRFFEEALDWFGNIDSESELSGKGEQLAAVICQHRTLLVLDAVESLVDPDPSRGGHVAAAEWEGFLHRMATSLRGLCVMTTSRPVAESTQLPASSRLTLEGLSADAGAVLLAQMGVEGTDAELRQTVEQVDGNCLALTLLGRYLEQTCHGKVAERTRIGIGTSDQPACDLVLAAIARWLGEGVELSVLRLVGLVEGRASSDQVEMLRQGPVMHGFTDVLLDVDRTDWKRAVARLRTCSLLVPFDDAQPEVLEAHPIVREYFARQLREIDPDSCDEIRARLNK